MTRPSYLTSDLHLRLLSSVQRRLDVLLRRRTHAGPNGKYRVNLLGEKFFFRHLRVAKLFARVALHVYGYAGGKIICRYNPKRSKSKKYNVYQKLLVVPCPEYLVARRIALQLAEDHRFEGLIDE